MPTETTNLAPMFVILAFFSVSGPGCGGPAPDEECAGELSVSLDFSPEERSLIYEAATRWNALAGREVLRLSDGEADACAVRRIESAQQHDQVGARLKMGEEFLSVTDLRKRVAWIDPSRQPTRLPKAVLHELGHELGLDHVVDGIMSPTVGGAQSFTAEDFDECMRKGIC
jgi:hypothetical protein